MKKKVLFIISGTLLVIVACNLSNTTPVPEAPDGNAIATSVALTVEASGQIPPPNAELPTPLPTMTPPPAQAPTEAATPTITLTATPSVPMVSVSIDTNCRTGPGKVYDRIGALMTNETAEVVGKNTPSNYWIIKNPDRNGNCWLWGQYATVAGNTANLQEYAVPPTPTPAPPAAPSNFAAAQVCVDAGAPNFMITVDLIWTDNSDNEEGFVLYYNGSPDASIPANQTQFNFTIPVVDSVPVNIGIAAYNATGVSAIQTIQIGCP